MSPIKQQLIGAAFENAEDCLRYLRKAVLLDTPASNEDVPFLKMQFEVAYRNLEWVCRENKEK